MYTFFKFVKRQFYQIKDGGFNAFNKKLLIIYPHCVLIPMYLLAIPIVLLIRLLGPFYLIRWQGICASRIGQFAANIELYLCEKDKGINLPNRRYFDIFFLEHMPICNNQLLLMWKRVIRVWPRFIFYPIKIINQIIPGGNIHEFGPSCIDRDINNLYDSTLPHLFFTNEEDKRGLQGIVDLGIPKDTKFVCLMVRDSAYLPEHQYHSYRDGDIQNYILAAEELTNRDYYVVRMGAKVNQRIKSKNPKIIDYAANGSRSDFMDIYLGAKCTFCISTSTGFDAVPTIFRKPNVFITVPVGYIYTFSNNFLSITKHHISLKDGHKLTLDEIFDSNVAYALSSDTFKNNGVKVVENSPEEIKDLVIEMDDRINGHYFEEDEVIRNISIKNYIKNIKKDQKNIHGEIVSLFGARFIEENSSFFNLN